MIELNPQNCRHAKMVSNHARITFTKSGSINFNKPAMKLLKLLRTSTVIFLLDDEQILVTNTDNGFCFSCFKSTQIGFSNMTLRNNIAAAVGIEDDRTFRLHIKPEKIRKKGYEACFELDKNYK